MGILSDDVVIIRQSEKEGDPSVITINCPDKTGLGCDLCRILLFFGLNIVRGGKFDDDTLIVLLCVSLERNFGYLGFNLFRFNGGEKCFFEV